MAKPLSIIPRIRGSIVPKNFKTISVTVSAGASTGTATVTAGSLVLGIYPAGNQDQFVDNVAISSTTLTVTLAANATAANQYKVTILEP
ncbi:hypothetical protein SAMN05421642_12354 [Rhodococcoides kyotonense]|uniref:Uncharacterized protein n=1 Tax=Rhodococcoides kyotonense TaxID=398843 RepID=A0A239MVU0_9NOCA|nr:hypothetical protein SAMN05421642_12354 [Rhodococcus kyotonensis]